MLRKTIYIQVILLSIGLCSVLKDASAQQVVEVLCGTWANREYTQGTQKLIIAPDGSYVGYASEDPSRACMKGNCKIAEKWSDWRGNFWYKIIFLSEDGDKSFCLMKVSASGTMIECVHDPNEFPRFFDAGVYTYRKYYRQ